MTFGVFFMTKNFLSGHFAVQSICLINSQSPFMTKQSLQTPTETPSEQPVVAKVGSRLIAILYDGMLILALLFLVSLILVMLGTKLLLDIGTTSQEAQVLPNWYQNFVLTPSLVVTLIGFYGVFWRRDGQTLGMQTWRLKTVNHDGKLLTWGQVVKRILSACIVPVLCALFAMVFHGSRGAILLSGFMGFIFNYGFCWFNRRGLAVHDLLSNTMTLKMPKFNHEGLFASFFGKK